MQKCFIFIFIMLLVACTQKNKENFLKAQTDTNALKQEISFLVNKIYGFKDLKNKDSLYVAAMQLKERAHAIGADTVWAAKFLIIYDTLLAGDIDGIKYLESIIEEESLAKKDSPFAKLYIKALGSIAYENETDYPVYARYLEKMVLQTDALKSLGLGYEVWVAQNLGEAYTRLNDNNAGLHYLKIFYEKSQLYSDEASRDDYCTEACFGLGNTYRNMGIYDSAFIYSIKALTFKKASVRNKAFATASLAEVYQDAGKAELALSTGLQAIKMLNTLEEDTEIIYRKAVTYSILADAFLLNKDLVNSLKNCNYAIAGFDRRSKKISREKGKVLLTKAKIYSAGKMIDSAFHAINQSLQTVIKFDAADLYAMPAQQDLTPENTIYEALDLKAALLAERGYAGNDIFYLAKALEAYQLSFNVEEKLMKYFLFTNTTLVQLAESRQRSQKAVSLCYQLYQLTKNTQWAQKAFQFAEKNKAFVLLESVKRNLATNSALQDDTLYKNVRALQLQLVYTERSLVEESIDSLKQKLDLQKIKLDNDLLLASTALGRQSSTYKTVMEKEDSISAALVSSSLLNDHTGLIEFFNADTVTYAFVLNKNQPIQFIKYNKTLSAEIDSLLYFFKTPSAISNQPLPYQEMAYRLYKSLQLDQMDKGWQNLIIIPDGKLSFLPFDALITNTNFTVNLQQANWFINQHNTLYGYSAGILLKQLHNNQAQYNNITVFAPVFLKSENQQQPLLYSLQEAEAIGINKNTTLFVKEKATLGNFEQQFTNSGILHIATHAYADTGLNSNPKIEFIDSSLLLNELYAMHTNASLVVLSACETGLGRLNSSEGPLSLARGFYYAGAKNVITSYWNVDDKSTASLFKSFYKNMGDNTSSDAVYLAKKELIKNESGKFASPYFWAGFVHFGMPQKQESKNYWWWLLFLVPVTASIYYIIRRNKVT